MVPDVGEVEFMKSVLNSADIYLRLFTNDKTPDKADVVGDYIEVAGAGYAAIQLLYVNWNFTPGSPSTAIYNAAQEFAFNDALGTNIYGFYITRDDILLGMERFVLPPEVIVSPINGSKIRIVPKFALGAILGD